MLIGGYYSSQISEKIKLLGLNTNIYYDQDKLTKDLPDPADQFNWMEEHLKASRRNNEKVILIMPSIEDFIECFVSICISYLVISLH